MNGKLLGVVLAGAMSLPASAQHISFVERTLPRELRGSVEVVDEANFSVSDSYEISRGSVRTRGGLQNVIADEARPLVERRMRQQYPDLPIGEYVFVLDNPVVDIEANTKKMSECARKGTIYGAGAAGLMWINGEMEKEADQDETALDSEGNAYYVSHQPGWGETDWNSIATVGASAALAKFTYCAIRNRIQKGTYHVKQGGILYRLVGDEQ